MRVIKRLVTLSLFVLVDVPAIGDAAALQQDAALLCPDVLPFRLRAHIGM